MMMNNNKKERRFPYRFNNGGRLIKFSEWGISPELVKKLANGALVGHIELSLDEIKEIYDANPKALRETTMPMHVKPREPDLILCHMWVGHQDYGKNPLDLI